VTFSFGRNWQKYLDTMPVEAVDRMVGYVHDWVPDLAGCRVVDVGSGQGLTSLAVHAAGSELVSFDVDPLSVEATRRLWEAAGEPASWIITQGSILDPRFIERLGAFDVVISWGVLHHTGSLAEALDAAASLVAPGGRLWIALYHRTRQSSRSLRTKRMYAALPAAGKAIFREAYAGAKVVKNLAAYRSLRRLREYHHERGMSWRRDVEDWLGGLPYEVSSPGEVLSRLRPQGFVLERLQDALSEGGNDVYLFRRR
jgi:2-polyprenyl-3-methyl-5-hydroxy-6-metoxy-1,4-benzoquinol methylase